jgi:hypothetical protein
MFVQHGFPQSEAERAAAKRQQDALQCLKELSQWQAVIVGQLEQLIRGGAPDRIRLRIAEASEEYGIRLRALMEAEPYRLEGPRR